MMSAPSDNIASPATEAVAASSPLAPRLRRRRLARLAWCVALVLGAALAYAAYWWTEQMSTERLRAAGAQRLEVYAASLENLLDKYDFLPQMLELDKDVLALLEHP